MGPCQPSPPQLGSKSVPLRPTSQTLLSALRLHWPRAFGAAEAAARFRAEWAVAGLADGPGGLGVGALPPRAPFGRVDAGVGEELVEVVEALDVADLGEQGRSERGSDPRDRLEPRGGLAVEGSGDAPVGVASQ